MTQYDVLKEAEPFYFEGNEIGVLVIHGFTGTTQSMRYIGEQLAAAGYTVSGPRLSGHGTDPKDMEVRSYEEWKTDVETAYEKLRTSCEKVYVVGLSMGGTLTLHLAATFPEIAGIMPINAAIELDGMKDYYETLKNGTEHFVDGIGSDIKQEGVEELAYGKTPVKSMGELLALMKEVKGKLHQISMPACIFVSTEDHVVPPANSTHIYNAIRTTKKEMIELKDSYHVATLDNDKEKIAVSCVHFIENN